MLCTLGHGKTPVCLPGASEFPCRASRSSRQLAHQASKLSLRLLHLLISGFVKQAMCCVHSPFRQQPCINASFICKKKKSNEFDTNWHTLFALFCRCSWHDELVYLYSSWCPEISPADRFVGITMSFPLIHSRQLCLITRIPVHTNIACGHTIEFYLAKTQFTGGDLLKITLGKHISHFNFPRREVRLVKLTWAGGEQSVDMDLEIHKEQAMCIAWMWKLTCHTGKCYLPWVILSPSHISRGQKFQYGHSFCQSDTLGFAAPGLFASFGCSMWIIISLFILLLTAPEGMYPNGVRDVFRHMVSS